MGTWCWGTRDPNPHGPAAGILLQAFDNFAAAIYDKLMLQTHLLGVFDGLSVTIDEAGYHWDISSVLEKLQAQYDADLEKGTIFISEYGRSLKDIGSFGEQLLEVIRAEGQKGNSGFSSLLSGLGFNNSVGGLGNDVLNGNASDDYLLGLSGNDRLYGGQGNDVLTGGGGNDYLAGGDGSDTYDFNAGDGQDTIFNADTDAEGSKVDVIRFGSGIAVSDVVVTRNYYDLVLKIKGSSDSVTVQSYFDDVTVANHGYAVDQINFADGTIWSVENIYSMAIKNTEGNDQIWGYAGSDKLEGAAGDDILFGQEGDDYLEGGAGKDTLYGARVVISYSVGRAAIMLLAERVMTSCQAMQTTTLFTAIRVTINWMAVLETIILWVARAMTLSPAIQATTPCTAIRVMINWMAVLETITSRVAKAPTSIVSVVAGVRTRSITTIRVLERQMLLSSRQISFRPISWSPAHTLT
ncbi:Calcium binding hemolysin protein [Pseudomonas amygdali pv. ciccaronei]|nr:Calcium binding hemolysin protein [Pseudomonas amygdali pv. ciccaronei]